MPAAKHNLPWNRPLPAQAAAWLAAGREGVPLDLSDTWVIVPTRQAGRRLREAIARHAHSLGTAALAPKVSTPDLVFEDSLPANRAPAAAVRLHWARTLLGAEARDVPDLFPRFPEQRTFHWALGLGERIARLRRDLAEGGLRLADVTSRAGANFPEKARWNQLAALESAYQQRLGRAGLVDPEDAKLAIARKPGHPPGGIARIAVIGCPDPMPLALRVLETWSKTIEVDVVVHAPGDRADAFDDWGRPLPEKWPDSADDPEDFEGRVLVCGDPADQASRIAAWAGRYDKPDTMLTVGAADSEVVPFIMSALKESGVPHFNPEGRPLVRAGLAKLISLLHRFAGDPSFSTSAELARRPEVLAWLKSGPGQLSPAHFLDGLDELEARFLPQTLDAAIEHAASLDDGERGLGDGLKRLAGLANEANRSDFPDGFLRLLSSILVATPADPRTLAEATEVRGAVDEVERAAGDAAINADEGWGLLLAALDHVLVQEERPRGALAILGWLELLWEDAPHIVVAGMNEGRVPEAITSDVFLPGVLRGALGLRTNNDRLARDAYILASIRAARGADGRLDLLVGRRDDAGDPLRPSRLLVACNEAALPGRVGFLFRSPPPRSGMIPWSRAWRLDVPKPDRFETISVTAFRDYLACPFRFYLKHGLKMNAVDPEKRELDVFDFGILVHAVLEQLGRRDEWRDCTDGVKLANWFSAELDRIATGRFGPAPGLPLVIQIESARQRLHQAAFVQAAARDGGWRIEEVEWKFPDDAVVFDGLAVRGKIDRIERHETTGVVRVLDYKTSDTPRTPADAHRARLGRGKTLRLDLAGCEVEGRAGEWTDLQLPIYRFAASRFGERILCGYFNLPKAVSGTAIEVWDDLDDAMQSEAVKCARAIAARVNAGVFWPPNEDAREDDFSRLFHEGVAASVEPSTRPEGVRR